MCKFLDKIKELFTENKREARPKPKRRQKPVPKNHVEYTFNDPTTPKLKKRIPLPEKPKQMNFSVRGFQGGGYARNTKEGQAANVYTSIVKSLNMTLNYSSKKITKWPVTNNLAIFPQAGRQLNAFYNRRALKFFYATDPKTKKLIYTADSNDIVTHELGHAVLDTFRPDLWSMQALEVWGYHEAYADIHSILSILSEDFIISHVIRQTKGDLTNNNVVSRIAEEMGNVIYNVTRGKGNRKPGALRHAINNFKYKQPERLPYNPPDDQLGGECHSFGRLFLGAWYDILVGIYNKEKRFKKPEEALKIARDVAGKYIVEASIRAPAHTRFYDSVARAMIAYDKRANDSKYVEILQSVFKKRKILRPKILMLSHLHVNDLKLDANKIEIFDNNDGLIVKEKNSKTIKMIEHVGLSAQQITNPLFMTEVEVPMDSYYEFNKDGYLVDQVKADEEEVLNSARACLVVLHNNNLVGNDDETLFDVEDGKLIRTHIQ